MQTSVRGVAFLVAHEGIVPAPYLDSVGVWTYGVGHTAAAGAPIPSQMVRGMPADLDAALRDVFAVFRRDLARYEADVATAIGRTPCEQHEFDAAVSFHFNTGAIGRAAWVDLWKSSRKDAAAASMLANWHKPAEIIGRRKAERNLFLTGSYGEARATVWPVSAAGGIAWNPVRALSQVEIIELMGASTVTTPEIPPTIRRSSRGQHVMTAQRRMQARGYDVAPDGIFGPQTEAVTRQFQRANGLSADGIIGPKSWAVLLA